MQPTPMHCIQGAFESYLITSGRYFGTTCTTTRANTTACAVSPTSTSLGSPSAGQRTCTTGSGCTPRCDSPRSRSHTGGRENGLVSKRVRWYPGKWSVLNFDVSCTCLGGSVWTCSYWLTLKPLEFRALQNPGDGHSVASSLLLFSDVWG